MKEDCAVVEKQIPQELRRLDGAVDELSDVVNGLEEGLSPVLGSPNPTTADETADTADVCSLANEIANEQRRIRNNTSIIRELLGRLEV